MDKCDIIPMGDLIVIEAEAPKKRVGEIILPENVIQIPNRGRVVAVGIGIRDINGKHIQPSVGVGDEVVFNRPAALELIGEKFRFLVSEIDILAIVEK